MSSNAERIIPQGYELIKLKDKNGHGHGSRLRKIKLSLEDRFFSAVDKNGPIHPHNPDLGNCWLWTRTICKKWGYGQIHVSTYGEWLAHRVAWFIGKGERAGKLCVCHSCDRPACVRFSHLFTGTHADNSRDKIKKGRQARPPCGKQNWMFKNGHKFVDDKNNNSKLSYKDAIRVKTMRASGMTLWSIANKFGVTASCICSLVRGKSWKSLKSKSL